MNLKNLVKALEILLKYGNPDIALTSCQEAAVINEINPADVSGADLTILDELGIYILSQDVLESLYIFEVEEAFGFTTSD